VTNTIATTPRERKDTEEAIGKYSPKIPRYHKLDRRLHSRHEVLRWYPYNVRDIFEDHLMPRYVALVERFDEWARGNREGTVYGKMRPVFDFAKRGSAEEIYSVTRSHPRLEYFSMRGVEGRVMITIEAKSKSYHPITTTFLSSNSLTQVSV